MVQWSRFFTITPWSVRRVRWLRRVTTSSPTSSRSPATSRAGPVRVEFTGGDASLLRVLVETVDGVVGVGHQRHRLAPPPCLTPRLHDGCLHGVGGAVVEATVTLILAEHADVALAETPGGVGFPLVGEAVDVVEFDGTVGVDEVGEHAAPTNGGELAGITHHHHPPRLVVGETGKGGEFRGGHGAGFIDDHRRPPRQVVRRLWWPVGPGVFVEELVQRVGRHGGFGGEHLGGCCGGCHPEHRLAAVL